ncbi:MAG: hypothetical protein AB8G05_13855 [Oligoflexales bacterium]
MTSRIESKEHSNILSTDRFLRTILLLLFCFLGASSLSFASSQNNHNIWVIGAPGAGKSALISAAITKLATPEIYAKLGNLNPDRLDEFGDQVKEDLHFFETLGKDILSRPSLAIGSIEGNGLHNPSNFLFKLKFSPVEISTDTNSSILHSTRYLNQYTHAHSGYSFIDTPGIKAGNAYQVANAINFSALTSKGGLQGSVNQIVALLQVNQQMLEEIQQEATTSSSWIGYVSQGLRKTFYYNDFERQIANIIKAAEGTVNLKQHGAPIQLVLVPTQDMLEDLEGIKSFELIKSLNETLSTDASLKVNLTNKISNLGLPVEGNQLITQLVNWTSIYESSLDLRDSKFSYYAEKIDSILDQIFNNKKLGLKFELGKKLEKSQKAIAFADVNLVSELPEKTNKYYQEVDDLKVSLDNLGQNIRQDLEEVEGLQARDIKLTKEKSRLPGLSILSSSDVKDENYSGPVNFRFASVSQYRDAVYHADFLFFGRNSEGQFGIFFDLDTFPRSLTGDLPPIPKKIDMSVKRIGQAEALVHSFEFADPKNNANKKTVHFELLSKDIKSI